MLCHSYLLFLLFQTFSQPISMHWVWTLQQRNIFIFTHCKSTVERKIVFWILKFSSCATQYITIHHRSYAIFHRIDVLICTKTLNSTTGGTQMESPQFGGIHWFNYSRASFRYHHSDHRCVCLIGRWNFLQFINIKKQKCHFLRETIRDSQLTTIMIGHCRHVVMHNWICLCNLTCIHIYCSCTELIPRLCSLRISVRFSFFFLFFTFPSI